MPETTTTSKETRKWKRIQKLESKKYVVYAVTWDM